MFSIGDCPLKIYYSRRNRVIVKLVFVSALRFITAVVDDSRG